MLNNTLLLNALSELEFTPEIDLFASRLNAQFPRYEAYRPDPGAEAVDAFPPFSIIAAVLKKIKEDRATGVCILPHWPTQAWFPMVDKMAIRESVVLPPSRSLLHLPTLPDQTHSLHTSLSWSASHPGTAEQPQHLPDRNQHHNGVLALWHQQTIPDLPQTLGHLLPI